MYLRATSVRALGVKIWKEGGFNNKIDPIMKNFILHERRKRTEIYINWRRNETVFVDKRSSFKSYQYRRPFLFRSYKSTTVGFILKKSYVELKSSRVIV